MITATAVSVRDVSDLIGAVAWPLVVLAIALIFRHQLRAVLEREFAITGPAGLSISAKGKDAAAGSLLQASNSRGAQLTKDDAESGVEVAAQDIEALGRSPRILWVDDHPGNNRYEVDALTSLGMHVQLSTSTEDALRKVAERGPYDVVISDMGRPPDDQAGYTLLAGLRDRGDRTPFVIYASSRSQEHFDMAVSRGAVGCTNKPEELVDMVANALRGEARYVRPQSRNRIGRTWPSDRR